MTIDLTALREIDYISEAITKLKDLGSISETTVNNMILRYVSLGGAYEPTNYAPTTFLPSNTRDSAIMYQ